MKIYTRGGDRGETSWIGPGRLRKDDARIEAYGTVDELNSVIGLVRSSWPGSPIDDELARIQSDLFTLGAFLASAGARELTTVAAPRIEALERGIDAMEERLVPLKSFILPGGTEPASRLHHARTVARRAERRTVTLALEGEPAATTIAYLNRLSDYLFVAARFANHQSGTPDVPWGGQQ